MKQTFVEVSITGEWITLGQLLKKMNLVASGGEVKSFLQREVLVNGTPENRRGRKLYKGDEILISGFMGYRIT